MGRELIVSEVLEWYDGPLLFTATDGADQHYVCYYLGTDDETRYMAIPVSKARLRRFLSGGEELRALARFPEVDDFFFISFDGDPDEQILAVRRFADQLTEEELPIEGVYCERPERRSDARYLILSSNYDPSIRLEVLALNSDGSDSNEWIVGPQFVPAPA